MLFTGDSRARRRRHFEHRIVFQKNQQFGGKGDDDDLAYEIRSQTIAEGLSKQGLMEENYGTFRDVNVALRAYPIVLPVLRLDDSGKDFYTREVASSEYH